MEAYNSDFSTFPDRGDSIRLTKSLLGDNPRHMAYLTLKPDQMNSQGEIIDEWGTPLRIKNDANHNRVQSAGPDRKWGTDDDLYLADPDLVER